MYTYAPPGSDPIATNALIGSLTTANSGPAAEFGIPTPEVSAADRAAGVIPTVDPKAQMQKLTAKKADEAAGGGAGDGVSKPASSEGLGGLSLPGEAAVTTATSTASEEGLARLTEAGAAASAESSPPEIPVVEKIETRVVGLYVYA